MRTVLLLTLTTCFAGHLLANSGYHPMNLLFLKGTDGNIYYLTNAGFFRSTDNGATWENRNSGVGGSFDQTPDGSLYLTNTTWTDPPAGSKVNVMFRRVAVVRSTDQGANWSEQAHFIFDPRYSYGQVSIAATNTGRLVLFGPDGILNSDDQGSTWRTVRAKKSKRWGDSWGQPVRSDAGTILVGNAQHLLRSTDGAIWTTVKGAVLPSDNLAWSAGGLWTSQTVQKGLFVSTDDGVSWKKVWAGDNTTFFSALITLNPGKVLGFGEDHGAGLHGTTVFTKTRSKWTMSHLDAPMRELYSLYNGSGSNIYGISYDATRSTTDNGATWTVIGTSPLLGSAAPLTNNQPLVQPSEYALMQNFPNPFNPATTISFSIPHAGKANLTVFDINGRDVARLLENADLSAGEQRIVFDGSALPSGTYFYRLQSGQFSSVRKFQLVK